MISSLKNNYFIHNFQTSISPTRKSHIYSDFSTSTISILPTTLYKYYNH